MTLSCGVCGAAFEAVRPSARFCSARCRKRNQRGPKPIHVVEQPASPDLPALGGSALTDATRSELEAARRADSALGRAALLLARRLDGAEREQGTAVAALVREHRSALAEAVRGAHVAADPVDELRARRDRKRAG